VKRNRSNPVNVLCRYFFQTVEGSNGTSDSECAGGVEGGGDGCHNFLFLVLIRRNFGKHVITGVANVYEIRDFRFLQRRFRRFGSSEKLHGVAALKNSQRFEAPYRLSLRIKQQNLIGHLDSENEGTEEAFYPTTRRQFLEDVSFYWQNNK
jgi:hypothetical protein